jgi:aryl-alcohol dehydrogenase-like predicted oxidoreductase
MCCSRLTDPRTPIEESWQTVCDLIGHGAVRAGGLSNHPVELMDRALAIGPVAVVQHQVPFLAWAPLASGFLADRFDLPALGAGDLRRRLRWADPAVLDLAALRGNLSAVAAEAGLSMTALAAGWVLARGTQPNIGARTPAEARQIAAVRPIPPGLAAAAQAAADSALTAAQ